jgi:hypothetical protein
VVTAVAFFVSGTSLLLVVAWWRPAVTYAAITSGIVFTAFWDGRIHRLAEQGGVGVVIDVATVLAAPFVPA